MKQPNPFRSNTLADALSAKLGIPVPVDPKTLGLGGLSDAVDQGSLKAISSCVAHALRTGELAPGSMRINEGNQTKSVPPVSPNAAFSRAYSKAIMRATSGKPDARYALDAWDVICKTDLTQQVLIELSASAEGASSTLCGVRDAVRDFMKSARRSSGSIEITRMDEIESPAPGIVCVGFYFNGHGLWEGETLERFEHPESETKAEAGDLLRQRLSGSAYIEANPYSYHDDEKSHDCSQGVLYISESTPVMDRFIAGRRSLLEIEEFFGFAANDTPAMLRCIEQGIPADIYSPHRPATTNALLAACSALNEDSVRELLGKGLNPSRQFTSFFSPLGAALGSSDAREVLYAFDPDSNPGEKASAESSARSRFFACSSMLLDAGADPDEISCTFKDMSVLSIACKELGSAEVISFFLRKGADPMVKDKDGLDLFEVAQGRKKDNIIALLDGWRASKALDSMAQPGLSAHSP